MHPAGPENQPCLFITGGTGFVGAAIIRILLENRYSINATRRSNSSTERLGELSSQIKWIDVGDCYGSVLEDCLRSVDGIVHIATNYGRSKCDPTDLVRDNILFPLSLYQAGRKSGLKFFVNTDTFYPAQRDLYSLTKYQFVQVCRSLAHTEGPHIVNLRLHHVYGPEDRPDKFIPSLIGSFLKDEPEFKLTVGTQLRDFIYIDDVARAYHSVIAALISSQESRVEALSKADLDVGSGVSVSLRAMIELLFEIIEPSTILRWGAVPILENEIMEACADLRGISSLGWKPLIDLKTGLNLTVEAYRSKLLLKG